MTKPSTLLMWLALIHTSMVSQAVFAELHYKFHWGRMSVAEFSLTLPTAESRAIRVEGETVGLIGKIFKYDGAIEPDYSDMQSVIFSVSGLDNGFAEYRTIQFSPGKPAEIIEFLDDEQEEPPSEVVRSMGNTVDPLRVVLALLDDPSSETLSLSSGDSTCEGDFSVFDGKRHYLLGLTSAGEEFLEADRAWGYTGLALRCEMSVTYLEATSGEEQNPWYEDDAEQRTVWLAEVEGVRAPVVIKMPGPIGKITGRLELVKEL